MSQVRWWMSVAAVLAISGCTPVEDWSTGTRALVADENACGDTVQREGNVFTVSASGGEDTAALQCVLDAAIASGESVEIRLGEGTFTTAQLVANGFHGTLRGAGTDATVLTNPDRRLTAMDPGEAIPTPAAPGPSLLAFIDSDVELSDLSIEIRGATPLEEWHIFGWPIHVFAHGILVEGTRAVARFERIRIEGEPADDLYPYNVFNGIFFEGFDPWVAPPPLSGVFSVHGSTFRTVASGTPTSNLRSARVVLTGNVYEDVFYATEIADYADTSFLFAGNRVQSHQYGVLAYDLCLSDVSVCGIGSTRIRISGNRIDAGLAGVSFSSTFGEGVSCAITGNQVQVGAGGLPYEFGDLSQGCVIHPEP